MSDDPTLRSSRTLDLPRGARVGVGSSSHEIVLMNGWMAIGWYGAVTREGIEVWHEALARVDRETEGKIGMVTCVRESSPPPDGEIRRAAAQILFNDALAVSMLVFEGTGFRAAIVRSVLAMMFTLGKNKKAAHKVVGDPREATR